MKKRDQWRLVATLCALMWLAGCGVFQAAKDGVVDATKWAFTTQIKVMNMELIGRASLNPNNSGQSFSTVLRVYQLKSGKVFEKLSYAQLQSNDLDNLKADLLSSKDVVLRPDSSISLNEPMNPETQYVGVVAFFREANSATQWKLLLPKKQWKETDPVKIEALDANLNLMQDGHSIPPAQYAGESGTRNVPDASSARRAGEIVQKPSDKAATPLPPAKLPVN